MCVCLWEAWSCGGAANLYSDHISLCSNEAQDEHDIGPNHSVHHIDPQCINISSYKLPSYKLGLYF